MNKIKPIILLLLLMLPILVNATQLTSNDIIGATTIEELRKDIEEGTDPVEIGGGEWNFGYWDDQLKGVNHLIINGGTINGGIYSTYPITINGGTITMDLIWCNNDLIKITGGTFTATSDLFYSDSYQVNVEITGGTFFWNPKQYVQPGHETIINEDGSYTVFKPDVKIKSSHDTLEGGGEVTLTLYNYPTDVTPTLTCNDESIELIKKDNVYTVTLPNVTKDYTFTASYEATDKWEASSSTYVISVKELIDNPNTTDNLSIIMLTTTLILIIMYILSNKHYKVTKYYQKQE